MFFLLIQACTNQNVKNTEAPEPIIVKPKIVELNLEDGYVLHPFTGDTIPPLLTTTEDTIISDSIYSTTGIVMNFDSLLPATIVPLKPEKKEVLNLNYKVTPSFVETVEFKENQLRKVILGHDLDTFLLVSHDGDTIITGKPMAINADSVPNVNQKPTKGDFSKTFKGSSYTLREMGADNGLNNNDIQSMMEDTRGNIWIGTNGRGIDRYDGEFVTNYLDGQNVSEIYEDSKGNIWLASSNHLIKYDGLRFTKIEPKFIKKISYKNKVRQICEDKSGNIWFTYCDGIQKYDGKAITYYSTNEGLLSNNIRSIISDKEGRLWMGTDKGVCIFDGATFQYITKEDGLISSSVGLIREDSNGSFWIKTKEGMNKLTKNHITKFSETIGEFTIRYNMVTDFEGNLWVDLKDNKGIASFRADNTVSVYPMKEVKDGWIMSLLADKFGNIYMGCYTIGIKIFNKNLGYNYNEDVFTTKEKAQIHSFTADSKGKMWIGNEYGLIKANDITLISYEIDEPIDNNFIRNITLNGEKDVWFTRYQKDGVYRFDGESCYNYTSKQGLIGKHVNKIFIDSLDNPLFCTDQGVNKLVNGNFIFYPYPDKLKLSIQSASYDERGNIWLGTYQNGLYCFDGKDFKIYSAKQGMLAKVISSILIEKDVIWMYTNIGLVAFDLNKFYYYSYTKKNDKSSWIEGGELTKDPQGKIWMVSNNSSNYKGTLAVIKNKEDLEKLSISKLTDEDGLNDGWLTEIHIDVENNVYLHNGSMNTSTISKLKGNKIVSAESSKINLNSIEINGKWYDFINIKQTDTLGFRFDSVQPFFNLPVNPVFNYNYNHLKFGYSGIERTAPEKLQYSYFLEGADNQWSNPSQEVFADYKGLSYGKYTFKVRSIGLNQQWSEAIKYSFTILPPWWHTWWARTLYIMLLLLLIFGIVKWQTAKLKKRQAELQGEVDRATHEIREQRDEILDSINYAKRIQSAILPPNKIVKEFLKESFILYKPKDIVAGDFYWMEHINGKVLFAAADCTGHGVPGAMVSVVCNNALNRSVREHGLVDPGLILDKTREIVIEEFEKSDEEVKDGMDVALCSLEGNKLLYAGAHNPLWIIRNGEIIETKANKQPIGKYDNLLPYTTHTFELQKNDTLYIFSDGYVDQFGGEKGKKFKAAAFRKLLLSIQSQNMESQKHLIDQAFEDWKGNLEQIDDVCVIGVRV